ncbi:hypothetical protein BZZ01_17265 [Nostocales cyanobacterium HT-58-2]|nr:hypothetical protein BZZ01_17265 [Nostocales cyanobacterium HT-58-2]
MRGWVGVGKEVLEKMAEFPTAQGFTGICPDKLSALLVYTGFQPFVSCLIKISYAMMTPSAL